MWLWQACVLVWHDSCTLRCHHLHPHTFPYWDCETLHFSIFLLLPQLNTGRRCRWIYSIILYGLCYLCIMCNPASLSWYPDCLLWWSPNENKWSHWASMLRWMKTQCLRSIHPWVTLQLKFNESFQTPIIYIRLSSSLYNSVTINEWISTTKKATSHKTNHYVASGHVPILGEICSNHILTTVCKKKLFQHVHDYMAEGLNQNSDSLS